MSVHKNYFKKEKYGAECVSETFNKVFCFEMAKRGTNNRQFLETIYTKTTVRKKL